MLSKSVWKSAEAPNYYTNVDNVFPYSEVPYLGEYNLVKIPMSLNNLIDHVDYWGEGLIVPGSGKSGFINCYNVNHQYQLVSKGQDRDRKIPNRIPVRSDTQCDTSAYIKDNSVITVTVSGKPINSNCATDIARIVNQDVGKVIAFGYDEDSQDIENLIEQLKQKGINYCASYKLPTELQGLTAFNKVMAFLNLSTVKTELTKNITDGDYDNAVTLSKHLNNEIYGDILRELVLKFIKSHPRNLMAYAYKLWHGGAQSVVRNCFPPSFSPIFSFNEESVTLINKQYKQALKLGVDTDSYNDRLAWGDSSDKTSKRVSWKLISVWEGNNVTFKLYNVDCNMFLKLDVNPDNIGDRRAWGSTSSNEERHRYYVEPFIKNGTLAFYIINCQYQQGLKLAVSKDSIGDRALWGHNGSVYNSEERYTWLISAF